MKQVSQRIRDGRIEVLDVPTPALTADGVLVDIRASLLSAGTERTKVETARLTLAGKARARPDQVHQVLAKARRDGVRQTLDAVKSRLDQPEALGYSAAGVVVEVGSRVAELRPGDRVACGGGGYAVHAEFDCVPGNLCVALPADVDFRAGAFTTVGSIALHGVRQADVRLGERVAVIGLGLVGQLTSQLLVSAGCRVVGVDLSQALVDKAVEMGTVTAGWARDALGPELPSSARECDAVVITAGTRSDDPVQLAAQLCRDRGRVVIVGDVGMSLPRPAYYGKELEIRLSRSYGPGRYDRHYEERGLDYPIGYVRWTERRNMAAFVDFIAAGKIDVLGLISSSVPVEEAAAAYDQLASPGASPLGIVLTYSSGSGQAPLRGASAGHRLKPVATPKRLSVVGAGSFATRVLIPAFKQAGFELDCVASASGLSARGAAEEFGFKHAVSPSAAVSAEESGSVVIATRHSSHASLAEAALRAGKAVFVEKPPCLTEDELGQLRRARFETGGLLVAGFNRRHAPLAEALRQYVAAGDGPMEILCRVNAGPLAADHWLNDADDGGGRLIGEGCHFVDLVCWLNGAVPETVTCMMEPEHGLPLSSAQRFVVTLSFADGSLASITYGAAGASGVGKEYLEVHANGRSAILDDFRSLALCTGRRHHRKRGRGDKGHAAQVRHFADVIDGARAPSAPDPLNSMAVTLAALRSAQTGRVVTPNWE